MALTIPASISYRSTPNDHQSTALVYGRYMTICIIKLHIIMSAKVCMGSCPHPSINFVTWSHILHCKTVGTAIKFINSKNGIPKIKQEQATSVTKSTSLWCHVVWCTTKCSRCLVADHTLFTHSKISDLYVPFGIQHHVVQLQVSVI